MATFSRFAHPALAAATVAGSVAIALVLLLGPTPSAGAGTRPGEARPIVGTPGPDVLRGTPGPDVILGLGGDDVIDGDGGDDVIVGGPGADRLAGGDGDDELVGGPDVDVLDGGAGDDRLSLVDDGRDAAVRGGAGRDSAWVDEIEAVAKLSAETLAIVPLRPIVYQRDGDIWAMRADGSGAVKLEDDGASPAWSPDGWHIAFWSTRDGNRELYVMLWDGSGVTRITETADVCEQAPSWSPDGQRLLFLEEVCATSNDERYAHLDVDAPATRVPVTPLGEYEYKARWRADGAFIYFQTGTSFARVFRVDPWSPGTPDPRTPETKNVAISGLDVSPLEPVAFVYARRNLSPNPPSTRIFSKLDNDPTQIGASLTYAFPDPESSLPDFSGDGTTIAYVRPDGVWRMSSDGLAKALLGPGTTPDWR